MEFKWYVLVVYFVVIRTLTCDNLTKSNSIDRRKQDEYQDQNQPPAIAAAASVSKCSSCLREDVKSRNIETIRDEVLKKLGMDKPPNMTGKVVPTVPENLLQTYKTAERQYGFQSDEPEFETEIEEDDEFHIKAEKIITFAQPCEYLYNLKFTSLSGIT